MSKADSMRDEIARRLEESAQIGEMIATSKIGEIESIVNSILSAHKSGGKVVLFGNGGSAADAQHLACELVGRVTHNRQALPAIALTTNTSTLTAIANDYGYETVFSRQVEALVNGKDIVIGISTSGNSPNVVKGIQAGKQKRVITIAFTGRSGGKLREAADVCLMVPSDETPHIQEAHITLGHVICRLVEESICSGEKNTIEDDPFIKVVALDIDGVLTNGTVTIDGDGRENKSLFFRDIDAIFHGRRQGLQFALISGEDDILVDQISKRLGIDLVLKGAKDKARAITELSQQLNVPLRETCYIGDSERDVLALEMVGLGVAPSNASDKAKRSAQYICINPGGAGAISEVIDKVLSSKARIPTKEKDYKT